MATTLDREKITEINNKNSQKETNNYTTIRNKNIDFFDEVPVSSLVTPNKTIGNNDSFKTLMVSFYKSITNKFGFRDEKNRHWNETISLDTINYNQENVSFVKKFIDSLKQFKVFIKESNDKFFIYGERNTLSYIQKQYKDTFSLINITSKDFYTEKTNFNGFDFAVFANENLMKKFNINYNYEKETYEFKALENLNEELKFEGLKSIITKEIKKEFENATKVNFELGKLKDENPYLILIDNFAKKNNIDTDLAINLLSNNEDSLKNYTGYKKILAKKDKILEVHQQYSNITGKTLIYLDTLRNLQYAVFDEVNKLGISEQKKQDFINSTLKLEIKLSDSTIVEYGNMAKNVQQIVEKEKLIEKKQVEVDIIVSREEPSKVQAEVDITVPKVEPQKDTLEDQNIQMELFNEKNQKNKEFVKLADIDAFKFSFENLKLPTSKIEEKIIIKNEETIKKEEPNVVKDLKSVQFNFNNIRPFLESLNESPESVQVKRRTIGS